MSTQQKQEHLIETQSFPCTYVIIEKYLTSKYKDTERKERKDIVNIIQATKYYNLATEEKKR